jgi:methylmalonyl-CoA mutase cobalamin-binding domain/chain
VSRPTLTKTDLTADRLRPSSELLSEGRSMARNIVVGPCSFLAANGVNSEAEYKRRVAVSGRIMQHAHIGFRSVAKTVDAIAEVHDVCAKRGVIVDRFGITLDWSMGYPASQRGKGPRGTGIVLETVEDFSRITNAAPAAPHFGDFMLGLPGAVENIQGALVAGATSIGNLGQYFTFRLPYWDDDVATTEATVIALGLIAAQDAEVLVHSNLDDGFAGLFADMCSSIGMVLIEKYIIETLIGAQLSHCYGHHFTHPISRQAFHRALSIVTDTPGTMIFGNTVSYRSTPAGNYASLGSYLLADIIALNRTPTGHAINPVPVTENERIPDVGEIIDAQTFATRMASHAPSYAPVTNFPAVDTLADSLVEGGRRFSERVLRGLANIGIDIMEPAELMLAIRRMGPKRMEALYGVGIADSAAWNGRKPVVVAEWMEELDTLARDWLASQDTADIAVIRERGLKVCIGTTDVHEHGKYFVEQALNDIGIEIIDGGVSTDAERLAQTAVANGADVIAVSTYNGVALRFASEIQRVVKDLGVDIPIVVGGRLNQVPEDSNSGLPVDVSSDIRKLGVIPCADLNDLLPLLRNLSSGKPQQDHIIRAEERAG